MLLYPQIDPVAFALGPVKVHWYGLMYLTAFAAAWGLASLRARRADAPVTQAQVEDLIFWGALGVVLGGRVGYVLFYNFDKFLADPLWLLRVWEGGMSFHGGLLGVVTAMALFVYKERAKKRQMEFGRLLDFIAPLVPVGLGLGRLGNFINGELWGRPSDVSWAMIFPGDPEHLARHPSQLYQLTLEGFVLFAIVWWYSARPRPTWSVGALFIFCYGVFRFITEFFREPDAQIGFAAFGWMSRGQELSLPMILIGAGVFVWAHHKSSATNTSIQKPL